MTSLDGVNELLGIVVGVSFVDVEFADVFASHIEPEAESTVLGPTVDHFRRQVSFLPGLLSRGFHVYVIA